MGRRPTPNPRRGILRAAVTVVVLTALLIVAILVVSSLSAPSAKAPTNPPTPGPITPVTTPTKAPHATPSPTRKKKTLGSLLGEQRSVAAADQASNLFMLQPAGQRTLGGIAVRSQNQIAWFGTAVRATSARMLLVRTIPGGKTRAIGAANAFIKPVWSEDGRFLLYVTSSQSRAFPGARWALRQYDARTQSTRQLAALPAVAMVPLGWRHGHPYFLVATASDTSLYTISAGAGHALGVLAPQVITSAVLSPGIPVVAFVAPTNCYNCTLDLYDLRTRIASSGPSGIANESQLAWSTDGKSVVTVLHDRIAVIAASSGTRVRLGRTVDLPKTWSHSLRVTISPVGVHVLDTITGRSVFSSFQLGTL